MLTDSPSLAPARHPVSPVAAPLSDHVALVTGAGSGIGRAIALGLYRCGATVWLVGRTQRKLSETARQCGDEPERLVLRALDLMEDDAALALRQSLAVARRPLDLLIHSNGVIQHAPLEEASPRYFDAQYRANVLAPFLLTQAMLPMLKATAGQIVFINSSAGLAAARSAGQFAATQHALRAMADALRSEVNDYGVRVLSVYPGRTATPRQEALYAGRGEAYDPAALLQPQDVAAMVISALCIPRTAEVTDLSIRPLRKTY